MPPTLCDGLPWHATLSQLPNTVFVTLPLKDAYTKCVFSQNMSLQLGKKFPEGKDCIFIFLAPAKVPHVHFFRCT
jgi:hypothetical protein